MTDPEIFQALFARKITPDEAASLLEENERNERAIDRAVVVLSLCALAFLAVLAWRGIAG